MHTRIIIDNYDTKSIVSYEGTNMTYPIAELTEDSFVIDDRTDKRIIDLVGRCLSDIGAGILVSNKSSKTLNKASNKK